MLRRPAFAATVIVTLAIGIGANAALFSLANTLYFRPLPVEDPARLVAVYRGGSPPTSSAFSYPLYRDVRDGAASLAGVIAYSRIEVLVGSGDALAPVPAEIVSGNYFRVLGVPMVLGRPLQNDDDRTPGAHPVAVVSHAFWREQLGAAPDIVGRPIVVNHRPYTVIGVAPPGFAGTVLGTGTQLWVPMAMQTHVRPPSSGAALQQGADLLVRRNSGWIFVAARLAKDVTIDAARSELQIIAERLEAQYPQLYRNFSIDVAPIDEQSGLRRSSVTLVQVLFGVVSLVLLVACTNVAGLLIARTGERWQEIAIRLALGASRTRLMRDVIAEYVFLALLGGAAGLLLARAGTSLLRAWAVPPALELPLDWRVIGFTIAVLGAAGFLISIWPAIAAGRSDANDALRGNRTTTAPRALARHVVVTVQLAIALVLVVSAGLALRTLWNVSRVDPGFAVDRVAAIPLDLRTLGMTLETAQPLYVRAQEIAASVAGVESAALVRMLPLSGGNRIGSVTPPGADPRDERSRMEVFVNVVTPRFFETLRIPILEGREFGASDTASSERVVVVSRALARELWPSSSALGQQVPLGPTQQMRVVGVVEDARYLSPRAAPAATMFFPVTQQPELGMTLLARTRADTAAIPVVLQRLRDLEPRLPLNGVTSLAQLFARQTRDDRMFAWTVGALAAVALGLAVMGIYGVVAFLVNQRRREVGVRIALGANASAVLWLILRQQAVVLLIGLGAGVALSSGIGRVLRTRLFDVPALDLPTYVTAIGVMAAAAGIAALVPARRALSTNPSAVLRAE